MNIAAWTAVLIGVLFFAMNALDLLRISDKDERVGNDYSKHGGAAYAFAFADKDEDSAKAVELL